MANSFVIFEHRFNVRDRSSEAKTFMYFNDCINDTRSKKYEIAQAHKMMNSDPLLFSIKICVVVSYSVTQKMHNQVLIMLHCTFMVLWCTPHYQKQQLKVKAIKFVLRSCKLTYYCTYCDTLSGHEYSLFV